MQQGMEFSLAITSKFFLCLEDLINEGGGEGRGYLFFHDFSTVNKASAVNIRSSVLSIKLFIGRVICGRWKMVYIDL